MIRNKYLYQIHIFHVYNFTTTAKIMFNPSREHIHCGINPTFLAWLETSGTGGGGISIFLEYCCFQRCSGGYILSSGHGISGRKYGKLLDSLSFMETAWHDR